MRETPQKYSVNKNPQKRKKGKPRDIKQPVKEFFRKRDKKIRLHGSVAK